MMTYKPIALAAQAQALTTALGHGAAKVSRRRVKHKPLSKAIVTEHNVTRQCKVVCFAAALQESLDA